MKLTQPLQHQWDLGINKGMAIVTNTIQKNISKMIPMYCIPIASKKSPSHQDRVLLSVVSSDVLVLHGTSQKASGIDSKRLLSFLCPIKQLFYYALL